MATTFTPTQLKEREVYRRAAEAVIWGLPIVNYELMHQVLLDGEYGKIVYWSKLLTWKNQTLTPNPDLIYYMSFFNVKDEPVVIEVPPTEGEHLLMGSICDAWQCALEDIGKYGEDKGAGAKYLVVSPDFSGEAPKGYIVLRSETYGNFFLFRSILKAYTAEALAAGLAHAHKVSIYPLSQAGNPPSPERRDMQDKLLDTTIPYDIRFFEQLHQVMQVEPWIQRDRGFIDALASIGIKKGEPFAPDEMTKRILEEAILEAHAWVKNFYKNGYEPFFKDRQWFFPVTPGVAKGQSYCYPDLDDYQYGARSVVYSIAFIGLKHPGAGQFYLVDLRDKEGNMLDSRNTYRMTVPADAPVKEYWSVALYDGDTHAFVRQQEKFCCSELTPGLQKNSDGSVDIYFGPKAPAGKEANWVPTGGSKTFELMFRFYGVKQEFFEKTWVPGDLEKINA